MNYICVQFSNFEQTQSILNMVEDLKNTEIIIFNERKIRGLKHKSKIHFLSFKKFSAFQRLLKKNDCLVFIDNVNFIFPNSISNIINNHKTNTLSLFCHTLGNNEMYLSQVMNFLPDIVTKSWREDYIDAADLNNTSLAYEMVENILFQKDTEDYSFLNFHKYKVFNINYRVQAICIDPNIIKKSFRKRPYSLSEIIYKTILKTKDKYIVSGSWIIEKSPVIDEMYNKRYCG
jgi:hypothetical protein